MTNDPVRRRHLRDAQERLRRFKAFYGAMNDVAYLPTLFIALVALDHWKHPPLSVQIAITVLIVVWTAGFFALVGIFFARRAVNRNS